jgi:hypothetical protein
MADIERQKDRVPPLNLTEEEITTLRTILQHHKDLGVDDDVIISLKEKADNAHSSLYSASVPEENDA